MPAVDVQAMVKNLDQRLSAVEQILPTLATKEDLKAYPTRAEMNEKFEEAKRFALVLHEDLKDDIKNDAAVAVLGDGWVKLRHGDVVIAAITSCTNTSNPSVMVAAGLVAKKAVEYGLKVPPFVKTSLAPGSRIVTN